MTHILKYDDVGSRREIWDLLDRLTPTQRRDFIGWCGRQVKARIVGEIRVVCGPEYTATEAFNDLVGICTNWSLDINVVVAKLVEVVRCLPTLA